MFRAGKHIRHQNRWERVPDSCLPCISTFQDSPCSGNRNTTFKVSLFIGDHVYRKIGISVLRRSSLWIKSGHTVPIEVVMSPRVSVVLGLSIIPVKFAPISPSSTASSRTPDLRGSAPIKYGIDDGWADECGW